VPPREKRCGEAEIKEWLQEEFPTLVTDVTEIDVQTEIDSLSQGSEEPLAQYYQRTINILRTHGRDKPRDGKASVLIGREAVMLNCVVNAFIKGLHDDTLRDVALSKNAATCRGLWKAY